MKYFAVVGLALSLTACHPDRSVPPDEERIPPPSQDTERWITSRFWGTWALSNCGNDPADVAKNLDIGEVGFSDGPTHYKVIAIVNDMGNDLTFTATLQDNLASETKHFNFRIIDGGVRLIYNERKDKPYFKCVKMGG